MSRFVMSLWLLTLIVAYFVLGQRFWNAHLLIYVGFVMAFLGIALDTLAMFANGGKIPQRGQESAKLSALCMSQVRIKGICLQWTVGGKLFWTAIVWCFIWGTVLRFSGR